MTSFSSPRAMEKIPEDTLPWAIGVSTTLQVRPESGERKTRGRAASAEKDFLAGEQETSITCGESAFAAQCRGHVAVGERIPVFAVGCAQQEKFAIEGIAQRGAVRFGEASDRDEKEFLAFVRILQSPSCAAVDSFIDARLFAFAAGHHVGNLLAKRHDPAKVERIAASHVQALPRLAFVDGFQNHAL